MLEMCINIFIRLATKQTGLHHVDQRRLEFKVSFPNRHVWSSRDIGAGESRKLIDRPLDHRCWHDVIYGIDGVRLLTQEKLPINEDTRSHYPPKWLQIVVKLGR
jgi:hypothetical protein